MDFSPARTRDILQRTPGVVRALLAGADPAWTERPYGPNTWSAKEVVAHLIFAERTDWIPRAMTILRDGERSAFAPFDRAGHKDLLTRPTAELLDVFQRERTGSLAMLNAMALDGPALAKRGTHPALGTVTLANLLATWAVHDLNHIAQMAKAMAYQYRGQVGPWEQYLSILAPPNPR